ncbi:phytase [Novosphingobium colocasiae]|uniref:phytase n=1 Tax=Novosphingobium colocasiae TaxID=1256513 RepID=UPI0035B10A36
MGAVLPLLLAAACASVPTAPRPYYPAQDVAANGETAPVGTAAADAADDPAIWRNTANPAQSLIVGTDKKAGLYVYGLDGKVRDFVAAGALNNVDLREATLTDGTRLILVGASDRTDRAEPRIALFWLDGATGKLTGTGTQGFLPAGHAPAEAYGFCMAAARAPGELARAYVVLKDGTVAESRLVEAQGRIVAEHLRDVKFATQSEGCAVDDASGTLFVAEEDVGIWRVPLAPATLTATRFAGVGQADGLVDDVEGLAITRDGAGRTLLVASSQGDNAYAVFAADDARLLGRFRIAPGRFGATSDTDGIEVLPGDFGPAFPNGLMVAQDGDNAPAAQNFKLVSWQDVAAALQLP